AGGRVVKTGAQIGTRVAVLDGLKPGDGVVASGQVRLNDGAVVTISTQRPAAPGNATQHLSRLYLAMKDERLRYIQYGRRRLIGPDAPEAFLRSLEAQ